MPLPILFIPLLYLIQTASRGTKTQVEDSVWNIFSPRRPTINVFTILKLVAYFCEACLKDQFPLNKHTKLRFSLDETYLEKVLSVQKLLSGSGHAGRLRLMEKYIGHRLVARPAPDNTFWTDSTAVYANATFAAAKCTFFSTLFQTDLRATTSRWPLWGFRMRTDSWTRPRARLRPEDSDRPGVWSIFQDSVSCWAVTPSQGPRCLCVRTAPATRKRDLSSPGSFPTKQTSY